MAKILLIEDDALVSRTMEFVFKKAGHETIVASDGIQGLVKFKSENPDIVISDIVMPDKDGIETIREIRGISKDVPIIAVSGGGRTHNFDFLRVAEKMGATEVVKKPFHNADIVALVERLLKEPP